MLTRINNVRVAGIAAAVSNKWKSLYDVSGESESVVKKIIKMTGVEGRYEALEKQTASDFCFTAAEQLIVEKRINRNNIGLIVFVTQTPDYHNPATACVLQGRLKLSQKCLAFDVNLGCSGFTYGITIAGSLLNNSDAKYALVLAGDTSISKKKDYQGSHAATMLFGDAGTAALLEKDTGSDHLMVLSKTDGAGFKAIINP